jgi:diadenosine tetraphosphatase ApaH/serine/threonine PP2A family protein phosphatase
MRVLVVSDVHSNLIALQAVLADAGAFDVIWSLGDIVGYGPEPNACIEELQRHSHVAIAGNHDWGVLGKTDLATFNARARAANLWTRRVLSAESRAYLEALPETHALDDVTLAHGSPRHPIWEYLLEAKVAKASFDYFDTPLCLVGHTHVPILFRDAPAAPHCDMILPPEETQVRLDDTPCILNPGSVGQPRDGDPRAAYLLYDSDTRVFEHRRVSYDIAKTQARMRAIGLPTSLISRLELGW